MPTIASASTKIPLTVAAVEFWDNLRISLRHDEFGHLEFQPPETTSNGSMGPYHSAVG